MIFNGIKCHVNTSFGLMGGMHPLHHHPQSAPELCDVDLLLDCHLFWLHVLSVVQ